MTKNMKIIRSVNFITGNYSNPTIPLVWRKIITAGLGQVVQNMLNSGPWGIIYAHNENAELKDFLREQYVGFIQIDGAWVDDEIDEYVNEESLLIPKVDESFIQAIATKYSQDVYFFARKKKFEIKEVETENIIHIANIKKHFKQFYCHGDELQFGNSKATKRQWILDYRIAARSNLIAAEIYDQQNEQRGNDAKLKLQIPKPSNAFIAWKKRPKYVGWEGVMVEEVDNLTPPGRFLVAYLPLS